MNHRGDAGSPHLVEFRPAASRELRKLPPAVRRRVLARLDEVALNPTGHPATRPLRGRPGRRLRVGDYRVLYEIENARLVVTVIKIAHRRHAYRT